MHDLPVQLAGAHPHEKQLVGVSRAFVTHGNDYLVADRALFNCKVDDPIKGTAVICQCAADWNLAHLLVSP